MQTINSIEQVLNLIDRETKCIIWDLDTIIKGSTTLGSSEWCYQILNHNSVQEIIDSMDTIYSLVKFEPIEHCTKDVLHELLLNKNIKQYFISPRGMRHYSYILKQIREAGLEEAIHENFIIFYEEMEHSKLEAIKSIKPKVNNFIYVSRFIEDLKDVNKYYLNLKRNILTIHYNLNLEYTKKDAIKDNEMYRQMNMFKLHVNKKMVIDYYLFTKCINITLILSVLWWWVFRFLRVII